MNGMFAGRQAGWGALLVLTTLVLPAPIFAQDQGASLADYLATTQLGGGVVTATGTLDSGSGCQFTSCLTGSGTINGATNLNAGSVLLSASVNSYSGSLADYLGRMQQGSITVCAVPSDTLTMNGGAATLRVNSTLDGTATTVIRGGTILAPGNWNTLQSGGTLTVSGGSLGTWGNANVLGTGAMTLQKNGAGNLYLVNPQNFTFGSNVVAGSGTLNLLNGNNYRPGWGTALVANPPSLTSAIRPGNSSGLVCGPSLPTNAGTVVLTNGGQLTDLSTMYGGGVFVAGGTLLNSGGASQLTLSVPSTTLYNGKVNIAGGLPLTWDTANLWGTVYNPVTLQPSGTLTLNNPWAYGGVYNVVNSPLNLINAGTLSAGTTVFYIDGPPSLASAVRPGSASGVACGPALPANASGTMTLSQPAWFSSGLVKQGTGTLMLNRDYTYGGTISVDGGTLRINANPSVIAPDTTLALNGTGTLTGGITVIAGQVDISSALAVSGTTLTIGQPGTVVLASDLISGGTTGIATVRAAAAAVPEPGSLALLGAAAVAALLLCRRACRTEL